MRKQILFTLMIFSILFLKAQDKDQIAGFINKTYVSLNKVQKEGMHLSDKDLETAFKTAVEFQMASVKSYKANKLTEAYEFSFNSRMICVDLLNGINKLYADYFNPTVEEKQLVKSDLKTLRTSMEILNPAELAKIDNLNMKEPQKLRELEINLN